MPQDLTPTNDELAVQPPKAGDDHTNEPTSVNRKNGKEESCPPGNDSDRTQGS
jgi:hypothetical protein